MKILLTESKYNEYKIIRRYDSFFDYLQDFLKGKENNIKGGFYTSVGHFVNHTVKYMTMDLIDFAIENKIDSLFSIIFLISLVIPDSVNLTVFFI